MTTIERPVDLSNLLDRAQLALDDIYNPDPPNKEPHELLSHVHARFEELRSYIKSNDGTREDRIIAICSKLIGDVASVAVLFERCKQHNT
jgi:hypothetical protein